MEHGTDALLGAIMPQLPGKLFEVLKLQQAASTEEVDKDLVQTCVFGMGVLAMKMPAAQFPLTDVFAAIEWVVVQDFKTERGLRAECVENAISSFGKCIYFHGGNLATDVVASGFLAKLPLTTDTEEAQPTHNLFF